MPTHMIALGHDVASAATSGRASEPLAVPTDPELRALLGLVAPNLGDEHDRSGRNDVSSRDDSAAFSRDRTATETLETPVVVTPDSPHDSSSDSSPVSGRNWMRWMSVAFFAVVVVGIVVNRSLFHDLIGQLNLVSGASMVSLGAFVLLHKLLHATMHRVSVPGMRLRRSLLATEAYVGASNAVVGGAGIGTGLRVAMYRSWGVSTEGVAVSVFVTALAPSFAMWSVAGAHTLPLVLAGSADRVQRITAMASICFLAAPGVFWWFALRRPEPLQWIAQRVGRVRATLLAVFPGRVGEYVANSRAARLDVGTSLEDLRRRAQALGVRRAFVMYVCAVGGQLAMAATLLGCVRALGPTGLAIDTIAVLRAFALLRVLSSFLPIPGGLGVLDVGLLGVLTSGGVARPTALAAIALYRGLTFVLPMITGSISAAAWRSIEMRRMRSHVTTEVSTDIQRGIPLVA